MELLIHLTLVSYGPSHGLNRLCNGHGLVAVELFPFCAEAWLTIAAVLMAGIPERRHGSWGAEGDAQAELSPDEHIFDRFMASSFSTFMSSALARLSSVEMAQAAMAPGGGWDEAVAKNLEAGFYNHCSVLWVLKVLPLHLGSHEGITAENCTH